MSPLGLRSLSRRSKTSIGRASQGFTLAGPEESTVLRQAQEPFVQPGYAELNPSYEQAPNTKPVWSLSKPLPRVVRPGMVPTKAEMLEEAAKAERPAEKSNQAGLDVDPNDLESGRIEANLDLRKTAAQVEDARKQRENNLVGKIVAGNGLGLSRTQSRRERLSSSSVVASGAVDVPEERLPTVPEGHTAGTESDDASSTADEQQGDFLDVLNDSTYPEDLHPLVQDLVEDEVHNNHTAWSVIRTQHREELAEALAVFVQLTIGFSADLAVTLGRAGNPNTTDWAWGFATMMAIYTSGGVSGAHLNPSITIVLWLFRGFPKRKMPSYFAAQFGAAFIAALASYGLYRASISHFLDTTSAGDTAVANSFVTSQRFDWIDPATAFFNEFLATAVLVVVILALGDDQNAPPGAGMNSLIIGLVITVVSIAFAYQTGAALNPSRDFGPRLALLALGYANLFDSPYWFYGPWAGSVSGALVGALLYDVLIFTGGESPVNYPVQRTKRAMKKGRVKWARRARTVKDGVWRRRANTQK